jgi:hypothetical protein
MIQGQPDIYGAVHSKKDVRMLLECGRITRSSAYNIGDKTINELRAWSKARNFGVRTGSDNLSLRGVLKLMREINDDTELSAQQRVASMDVFLKSCGA